MKSYRALALALATVGFAGTVTPVNAQDDAAMIQRRDEKLAEPWLKKANWITDYDVAREESKKTGKPIFGYFTRSYSP